MPEALILYRHLLEEARNALSDAPVPTHRALADRITDALETVRAPIRLAPSERPMRYTRGVMIRALEQVQEVRPVNMGRTTKHDLAKCIQLALDAPPGSSVRIRMEEALRIALAECDAD